jgi:hypothetical protein
MKSSLLVLTVVALLACSGCGGSSGSSNSTPPPPPPTFTLGGTVTGLSGTLVLQDNLGNQLTFSTDATQTFSNRYASGATYSVTVATPPSGQTCTPSGNAAGTITANVTVTVTCTAIAPTLTISAAVTGLSGTLVLQDNLGDQLTFTTNTTQMFSTRYASGATYSVSVATPPSGQTCTLGSNSSGTITANVTVTVTCSAIAPTLTISAAVTGLSGTLVLQDNLGDQLTFTTNTTQTFATHYASGATYSVSVATPPSGQTCTPGSNSTGTITANTTVTVTCTASGTSHPLGSVIDFSNIACKGQVAGGVCQQLTVSCPDVPNIFAFVKTNTPASPVGTVLYAVGTDGNGLYDSIFTFGDVAVQNVLDAGFRTVQISFGTPFNTMQPGGWVEGPVTSPGTGVLTTACRYATIAQWVYSNLQNDKTIPMCATANSGGAGVLAYALSQYGSNDILSMAEVTSGPPTARLDWGCGCLQGSLPVSCGATATMGTCFGVTDAGVWDPAYTPNATCTDAVNGTLPPGGLNFFLDDSVEAPGAVYNFPKTNVNIVFGGADTSAAIPIGLDWYNNISSKKSQACVVGGLHSLADTLAGADQIANDLISLCKLQ